MAETALWYLRLEEGQERNLWISWFTELCTLLPQKIELHVPAWLCFVLFVPYFTLSHPLAVRETGIPSTWALLTLNILPWQFLCLLGELELPLHCLLWLSVSKGKRGLLTIVASGFDGLCLAPNKSTTPKNLPSQPRRSLRYLECVRAAFLGLKLTMARLILVHDGFRCRRFQFVQTPTQPHRFCGCLFQCTGWV